MSQRYDRKARVDPSDDLAELLEPAASAPSSTLIDFGADGDVRRRRGRVCKRVVAVDVSPAMIAAIRVRAARRG